MTRLSVRRSSNRRGAVVVLVAVVMILFVAMAAFMIDYGYIMTKRTDLQRAADAAALAAVQDLIPAEDGSQDLAAAVASVRSYVADNLNESGFTVKDADIEIGRFDTTTIYSNVTLLNDGTKDAVRVTLRRDGASNALIPLFFARTLGANDAAVTATATAVLQKPTLLRPDQACYRSPYQLTSGTELTPAIHGQCMATARSKTQTETLCQETGARLTLEIQTIAHPICATSW